jgi:hypothetical protein
MLIIHELSLNTIDAKEVAHKKKGKAVPLTGHGGL